MNRNINNYFMNWDNLIGSAINFDNKTNLDLIKLEYKIMYVVQLELDKFKNLIRIDKNNKYGKWDII